MTNKTKHYLRHFAYVGALSFVWISEMYLVDAIEHTHAIQETWKTPLAVLTVAVSIVATIYAVIKVQAAND